MDKFFWGASTSAHQVEGGHHNDWTEWEKKNAECLSYEAQKKQFPWYITQTFPNPHHTENYISSRAADHYNRFKEDFDIAKSLGHNAHSFSIEWSRIEPEEGKFDEKEIVHYRKVISALRARDIEPFVTLWHWTLPVWLRDKGGVLAGDFPKYFERYAKKLAESFPEVRFWMTINEPEIFSRHAYFIGNWPPQKTGIINFYRCQAKLIHAHRKAYRILKSTNPSAQVGVRIDPLYFEAPSWPTSWILKFFADRVWNFHFVRHVRKSLDFIGINYYFHNRITWWFGKNKNKSTTDMGWEIYPEGIYHVLKSFKKFNLPIYITENGLADAQDKNRGEFIKNHIKWIKKAMSEGALVRGYFHWSLLDNFEWDKGFWPRFGLVEVDYKTMERRVRQSAKEYSKIIKENF